MIRNFVIKMGRRNKQALVVERHPGTVDTLMSKPFQRNVPANQLFSPAWGAGQLWSVIDSLIPQHNGKVLAWDGSEVPA